MTSNTQLAKSFERWVTPFISAFRHKAQRQWAPLYLQGLLGPGDRKSMEPIARRVAPAEIQQLHHFVATSKWDTEPLEEVLRRKADGLVGGDDAHLIVDDTSLPKKGKHSVGVTHQYCGALGKNANCQSLVSLTLARHDVPIPIALRLYLPESWASDVKRRRTAGVPEDVVFRPKWQIALAEIRRVIDSGVRFGDVLADGGYGCAREFREGLTELGLQWAVGITCDQIVYSTGVVVVEPVTVKGRTGRPRSRPRPSEERSQASAFITALGPKAFRRLTWRQGTKGPLTGLFAVVRVRPGDGREVGQRIRLPGNECWLVCEQRSDERKYYLTNHPAGTSRKDVVAAIKARWSCEQAHQQLKEELGLDHFEGRSWHGLHHHALLTMIACAFLQHTRLLENKV